MVYSTYLMKENQNEDLTCILLYLFHFSSSYFSTSIETKYKCNKISLISILLFFSILFR